MFFLYGTIFGLSWERENMLNIRTPVQYHWTPHLVILDEYPYAHYLIWMAVINNKSFLLRKRSEADSKCIKGEINGRKIWQRGLQKMEFSFYLWSYSPEYILVLTPWHPSLHRACLPSIILSISTSPHLFLAIVCHQSSVILFAHAWTTSQ